MAGSDSLVAVTDAIVALMKLHMADFGFQDVWYGEESLIPHTPAISVTPDTKTRGLIETGSMTNNTFIVFLTIYHSRLDTSQVTRRECDIIAEDVEALLHQNPQMSGTVLHGYVSDLAPGFSQRNRVILRSTRLTWRGLSKTRLF